MLSVKSSIAQVPIAFTTNDQKVELLPYASFVEDKTGLLNINDVKKSTSFLPITNEYIQKGFTSSVIWVKFSLTNNDTLEISRLLEINNKELDSLTLYAFSNDDSLIYISGDYTHAGATNFFPTFPIQLKPQNTAQYFLRVKTSSAVQFNVALWQEVSYMKYLNIHDKFLWLFIGILFIRLIYVLVLSRFIKDKPFSIYAAVIFLLFIGVLINAINLKALSFTPFIANYLLNAFYIILPMGLAAWVFSILKKYNHPRNIKYVFIAIYSIGIIGLVAGFWMLQKSSYSFACNVYLQVTLGFLLLVSFSILFRRKQVPIIYLLPGIFLIFNQLHYSLMNLNVYPFTQLTLIIISALFSTEVITMSLLLGNILKRSYRTNLETMERLQNVRNKISADLHDELGSVLTQISLQTDMINSGIYSEEEKRKELEAISATSRQAIHAMSDIVWSVKAGQDTIGNLIDRMKDHADIMLQQTGAVIKFEANGLNEEKEIDNHLRQELFFIYKEAITNIVKHSHPANVVIRIDNDAVRFEMQISNDINQPKTNTVLGGNGIPNMKKRSVTIGALLETIKDENRFTVRLKRDSI